MNPERTASIPTGEARHQVPTWLWSPVAAAVRMVVQRGVLKPLVWSLTSVEVSGRERLAGVGAPFVVVANHASHLDAPLIVTALPRHLTRRLAVGAAADYFFDSRWRALATGLVFNAFPIDRGRDRPMRGTSSRLLATGLGLLVFPEGTRSHDGSIGDFRPGAAALCVARRVSCVPAAVIGAHQAMPRGSRWPRPGRPKVRVRFGEPLSPRSGETVRSFARRVRAAVVSLHEDGPGREGS